MGNMWERIVKCFFASLLIVFGFWVTICAFGVIAQPLDAETFSMQRLRNMSEPRQTKQHEVELPNCKVSSLKEVNNSHHVFLNLWYTKDVKYYFSCEGQPYSFRIDAERTVLKEGELISFFYKKNMVHYYDKDEIQKEPPVYKEIKTEEVGLADLKEIKNITKK